MLKDGQRASGQLPAQALSALVQSHPLQFLRRNRFRCLQLVDHRLDITVVLAVPFVTTGPATRVASAALLAREALEDGVRWIHATARWRSATSKANIELPCAEQRLPAPGLLPPRLVSWLRGVQIWPGQAGLRVIRDGVNVPTLARVPRRRRRRPAARRLSCRCRLRSCARARPCSRVIRKCGLHWRRERHARAHRRLEAVRIVKLRRYRRYRRICGGCGGRGVRNVDTWAGPPGHASPGVSRSGAGRRARSNIRGPCGAPDLPRGHVRHAPRNICLDLPRAPLLQRPAVLPPGFEFGGRSSSGNS